MMTQHGSDFIKLNDRRAVSQVIGSLLMMAIVGSIGSVILFQGLSGIQGFNELLSTSLITKTASINEGLMIEHVRFNSTVGSPGQPTVISIWVRNTGIIDAKIQTVKIFRIDDQEQVLLKTNIGKDVVVKQVDYIRYNDVTNTNPWNTNHKYKISLITEKGNSFTAIVSPYNW